MTNKFKVMKPSTRQIIARVGILASPFVLIVPLILFSQATISFLPAILVLCVGVFFELNRIRMRMFQFTEYVGVVWLSALIATVSLHFVLGGLVLTAKLGGPALVSYRSHAAALDANYQRADWATDLPSVGTPLRTMSVIINAHNEHKYLVRTLEGVLSTAGVSLVEIIVIDDGSTPALLPLVETSSSLADHLVKNSQALPWIHVVRHDKQEGLIRSKIHGASLASGDVLVFLDAHVKPFADWAAPMFRHINQNYKRVVAPVIPILTEDWTVESNAVGFKMIFDWKMDFHWFDDKDWPQQQTQTSQDSTLDAVPILSGGLFAISRRWWFESGEYDPQMLNYGAENIEQSIRVWLCGGEITVARDSRIAHLFRPLFPYKVDDRLVMINKARTVKVWFNDPASSDNQTDALSPWQERVLLGDPNLRAFMNLTGDVSARTKLRAQCRDFQWFVDRFRQVFQRRGMLDKVGQLLRHNSLCMAALADKPTFVDCDKQAPLQNVQFADGRVRVKALCLDANAQERDKLNKPVLWYHCDFGKNSNQAWELTSEGKLRWLGSDKGMCGSEVNKELIMTDCASASVFTLQS